MGFFSNLLQGKPAFENPEQPDRQDNDDAAAGPAGPKILPLVVITRVDCRLNGDRMDVYTKIANRSAGTIELDKVRIFGTTRELDNYLKPGEEKQYLLYSGQRPLDMNKDECEIDYKDASGDYFAAIHDIEFKRESDRTYSIRNLKIHL